MDGFLVLLRPIIGVLDWLWWGGIQLLSKFPSSASVRDKYSQGVKEIYGAKKRHYYDRLTLLKYSWIPRILEFPEHSLVVFVMDLFPQGISHASAVLHSRPKGTTHSGGCSWCGLMQEVWGGQRKPRISELVLTTLQFCDMVFMEGGWWLPSWLFRPSGRYGYWEHASLEFSGLIF